jgi:phospholipid transport system transporter-binding protein
MTNNGARIRPAEDGSVQLCGDLTFDSTPYFYEQLEGRFESSGEIITVDLGEIARMDSSGLALLLEWQAMANRQRQRLRIIHAPDILFRLAKLCEADKLLELVPPPD